MVAGRRVDASMTLLREVMERPLDPSYAAAAAAPRPPTLRRTVLTLVLAVVAGAAFSVSVGTIRQPQRQSSQVNSQLRNQIERRTKALDKQQAANAALSARIAMTQQNALGAGVRSWPARPGPSAWWPASSRSAGRGCGSR
jgi:hypothetical protein